MVPCWETGIVQIFEQIIKLNSSLGYPKAIFYGQINSYIIIYILFNSSYQNICQNNLYQSDLVFNDKNEVVDKEKLKLFNTKLKVYATFFDEIDI